MLGKLGFKPLTTEVCLFYKDATLLLLYVDDLLIADISNQAITHISQEITKIYKIREIGEVREFLGISIVRDRSNHQILLH
jgi:Reverse transcriptase (RNA-dependent DNA polymerase)